jgi:hypothetical protein
MGDAATQGIDATELQAILRSEIDSAVQFIENDIGPDRAESTKYYRGDPLGNEEEGRSRIVTRDVRDAVRQTLPSLVEVFLGSERANEFVPARQEDVAQAEQATDYILHIITNDNPGVSVFYSALKDSLYNKAGVIKWWRDESFEVKHHPFSGLDDAALGLLLAGEEGVELVELTCTPIPQLIPMALMQGVEPPSIHEGRVKRVVKGQRFRIAAVPPEEFLIDRNARDIDSAVYVGHRCLMAFSDLVALGYPPDLVQAHIKSSATLTTASEVTERYRNRGGYQPFQTQNKGEQKVLYVESYIRVDVDGDGISELRKFCSLGDSYEIVNGDGLGEPVDERPFAAFCPDPEPHMFFGDDVADMTKDIQKVRTNVTRAMMDSLALAIYPRMTVVEGQVNIEDALNTEMGAIIRQNQIGMVSPLAVPFVGKEALVILDHLKQERDSRLGLHNMAMDADSLQSTTKAAVTAQERAATANLKMIARLYAETGFKRLMKGLLRLVVAHQDQPRMVRLRNTWVQVDPRAWNADMDVSVNVGLGQGMAEDRIAALQMVKQTQEQILQTLGPNNPLCDLGQYRLTLAKLLELAGYKDPSQFFKAIPPGFQVETPPPQPSPEQLLAQVEMEKIRADMATDAARLNLDRDKLHADILLRAEEINVKYGTQVNVAQIKATVEQDRIANAVKEAPHGRPD